MPRLQTHLMRTVSTFLSISSLLIATTTLPAQAQSAGARALGGLLGVGGYFFTSRSGRDYLRSVQFANDAAIFVRPRRVGPVLVTGGVQFVNASDRFFPFSGGNGFSLVGPAVGVATPRGPGRIRGFVTGGLFYGQLRGQLADNVVPAPGQLAFIDTEKFVASGSFGVAFPLGRYVTLEAAYRLTSDIGGVNLNGFQLNLRVFSTSF